MSRQRTGVLRRSQICATGRGPKPPALFHVGRLKLSGQPLDHGGWLPMPRARRPQRGGTVGTLFSIAGLLGGCPREGPPVGSGRQFPSSRRACLSSGPSDAKQAGDSCRSRVYGGASCPQVVNAQNASVRPRQRQNPSPNYHEAVHACRCTRQGYTLGFFCSKYAVVYRNQRSAPLVVGRPRKNTEKDARNLPQAPRSGTHQGFCNCRYVECF